jgi:hypothetical protein
MIILRVPNIHVPNQVNKMHSTSNKRRPILVSPIVPECRTSLPAAPRGRVIIHVSIQTHIAMHITSAAGQGTKFESAASPPGSRFLFLTSSRTPRQPCAHSLPQTTSGADRTAGAAETTSPPRPREGSASRASASSAARRTRASPSRGSRCPGCSWWWCLSWA